MVHVVSMSGPLRIRTALDDAEALRLARHHVQRAQHDGRHEQDRHDARKWMDEHGDGRCRCDRCERDEARFQ